MVVNNNYLNNINKITGNQPASVLQKNKQANSGFENILNEKLKENSGLKFSKHAEQRLQSRNISLTDLQKDKINKAVSKADEKGVKESLVMMDNLAFVVNVKSRTVITAVNSNELKDNVFTNIDGAVFG
jgi:flagellar operon protein